MGEIQFGNKPTAFPELEKEVRKYTKKGVSAVYGLEDVGGYGRALAVYLTEKGCWVKKVNSKLAADRRRGRITVLGRGMRRQSIAGRTAELAGCEAD